MDRVFFVLGCVLAGSAVALGAFGAHALKARLAPEMLAVYDTGVRGWGAVTPIGGLAWLAGWAALAWGAWRSP